MADRKPYLQRLPDWLMSSVFIPRWFTDEEKKLAAGEWKERTELHSALRSARHQALFTFLQRPGVPISTLSIAADILRFSGAPLPEQLQRVIEARHKTAMRSIAQGQVNGCRGLSVQAAAKKLGCSRQAILERITRGTLLAVPMPDGYLIPEVLL